MLDIRSVREHADEVQTNAKNKGYDVNIEELLKSDGAKRQLQQQADELREKRNEISSRMKGGKPTDELIAEGKAIKDTLTEVEANLKEADQLFTDLLKKVPNMALGDVPVGVSEDENVVAKRLGEPTKFNFAPKIMLK